MKKYITIVAVAVFGLVSCKKETTTPTSNTTSTTSLPETYITFNDGTVSNTYKISVFDTYVETPSDVVNGVPIYTDSLKTYHASTLFTSNGMPAIGFLIKIPRDSSEIKKMMLGKYTTWESNEDGDDFKSYYKTSRGCLGFMAQYNSSESPYVNSTDNSSTINFNKINKITYINSTWNQLYKRNLPNYYIEGEYSVKVNQVGTSNSKTITGTYKLKFISNQKVI